MSNSVAIIGYSGHSYVVIEAARMNNIHISGYCESVPSIKNPYDLIYLGNERAQDYDWQKDIRYFIGIGDNTIRRRITEHVIENGGRFTNIIHPSSWVSDTVIFGAGVFVNAHASVNALASIGDQCILNTGSVVEHECTIGRFAHIAPGAVLAGNVSVGNGTFIGANAVVKQGVRIGENAIVGAGAVVIQDVEDGQVVFGNPAKRKIV
ncbi:acetyltransferase [Sphingobacterium gobiense]|uniref:acetyltransferase n=1 Tax=Sphingobacterium gobiense TaxID=1382456 RepID=UPI0015E31F50|nr:acetyltransferase [Sphingobacterium gobiense]